MVNLDHFKRVNDNFGHACGDQLLQRVAAVFRHSMRHHDLIARMGGEEFALLLPQTDLAAATIHA
jgi:diguanylate cyclase (GGDEF)-like protein